MLGIKIGAGKMKQFKNNAKELALMLLISQLLLEQRFLGAGEQVFLILEKVLSFFSTQATA